MMTTIDVHYHPDDTTVEVNDTGTGIVLRDIGSFDPRLNIFLGDTPEARSDAARELISKLHEFTT